MGKPVPGGGGGGEPLLGHRENLLIITFMRVQLPSKP